MSYHIISYTYPSIYLCHALNDKKLKKRSYDKSIISLVNIKEVKETCNKEIINF
jgi:hypothetical protein